MSVGKYGVRYLVIEASIAPVAMTRISHSEATQPSLGRLVPRTLYTRTAVTQLLYASIRGGWTQ
jgi:hypothetical protein